MKSHTDHKALYMHQENIKSFVFGVDVVHQVKKQMALRPSPYLQIE